MRSGTSASRFLLSSTFGPREAGVPTRGGTRMRALRRSTIPQAIVSIGLETLSRTSASRFLLPSKLRRQAAGVPTDGGVWMEGVARGSRRCNAPTLMEKLSRRTVGGAGEELDALTVVDRALTTVLLAVLRVGMGTPRDIGTSLFLVTIACASVVPFSSISCSACGRQRVRVLVDLGWVPRARVAPGKPVGPRRERLRSCP